MTNIKAYELAKKVCDSYNIENYTIWIHNGLTDQSGQVNPVCSVSIFGNFNKVRINVGSSICDSLDAAIKKFELLVAAETQQEYQRCAEWWIHYEEENHY